jgi:hypothetical protein
MRNKEITTYIGSVESLNACVIPICNLRSRISTMHSDQSDWRNLNVLHCFLFTKHPFLPILMAILHGPQNYLRYFETRISESNCGRQVRRKCLCYNQRPHCMASFVCHPLLAAQRLFRTGVLTLSWSKYGLYMIWHPGRVDGSVVWCRGKERYSGSSMMYPRVRLGYT